MYECIIQKQGDRMAEPYRSQYFALLANRYETGGLSHTRLANELKKAGLKASAGGVSNHRNLSCVCGAELKNE